MKKTKDNDEGVGVVIGSIILFILLFLGVTIDLDVRGFPIMWEVVFLFGILLVSAFGYEMRAKLSSFKEDSESHSMEEKANGN